MFWTMKSADRIKYNFSGCLVDIEGHRKKHCETKYKYYFDEELLVYGNIPGNKCLGTKIWDRSHALTLTDIAGHWWMETHE